MGDESKLTDGLDIYNLFRKYITKKERLWSWQTKLDENGNRPLNLIIVTKIDIGSNTVDIRPTSDTGFHFSPDQDVFIFDKNNNYAFKIKFLTFDTFLIKFKIPKVIGRLEKNIFQKFELVEKENEKVHLAERESQRIKAKKQELTSLRRTSSTSTQRNELKKYVVYDFSVGGMAFLTSDPSEYQLGESIEVCKVGQNSFPQPIRGLIRGIRELKDDVYKIGVKFI